MAGITLRHSNNQDEFQRQHPFRWLSSVRGCVQMQLSELTPGMVIAGGCRSVTERDIVEFEARFLGISASPSEEGVKRKRKSTEVTASVWMICAIAQELASRTELNELWSAGLPVIERLSWCDSVRPGDELRLKIEILDKRRSHSGTASWVRWQWILATAVGVRALDLMAGSFLEDRSPSQNDRVGPSANRISYKVIEAAKMVGLSKYVLYDAIRNLELPAYRPSPPPCQHPVRHLPWAIYSAKAGPDHDPINESIYD